MERQPTNLELLDAIQQMIRTDLSKTEANLRQEIQQSQTEVLDVMQHYADETDRQIDELGKTVANLPTKAYMDDKFADEGVRYGGLIRETNEKIGVLTDELVTEGSLSTRAAVRVVSTPPFSRRRRRT